MSKLLRSLSAAGLVLILAVGLLSPSASAAKRGSAVVDSMPYTDSQTVQVTWKTKLASPAQSCVYASHAAVTYSFTPASAVTVTVDTLGSLYDTVLSYGYWEKGTWYQLGCNDDYAASYQSGLSNLSLTAGTTYFFEIAIYGDLGYLPAKGDVYSETLQFNVAATT